MNKIESFKVNHLNLQRGLYVSRKDEQQGVCVTTFDLRLTLPNVEMAMSTAALHTVEHLGATYLRNSAQAQNVVYFGPMGCRTGCYLIMFGKLKPEEIYDLVMEMCDFIIAYDGEIPGAKPEECGNYREQNLDMAKYYISNYKKALIDQPNFEYRK